MYWRSIIFAAVFLGTITVALPHLLWFVGWVGSKVFSYRWSYAPCGWTALGLLLLVWSALIYGFYWGRYEIRVNNIEYCSEDLPKSFDGFRVVHISDLHVDSFDDHPEALQKVVDRINAQNPDIVLFTGDMNTRGFDNMPLHEKALSSLRAKHGVVSILGNHDFFIYEHRDDKSRCQMADSLTQYEQTRLGWRVLRNEHILLRKDGDSLAIAGVDNIHGGNQGFRTVQKGDLRKALSGISEGMFTILMTHDPSHWRAEVLPHSTAQITLSGHTHAGQVRLFGWAISRFAFQESDGRYDQDGRMLYVNQGTGCTMPLRVGCPSEITVITLKRL